VSLCVALVDIECLITCLLGLLCSIKQISNNQRFSIDYVGTNTRREQKEQNNYQYQLG
jgi:hypothetical protein